MSSAACYGDFHVGDRCSRHGAGMVSLHEVCHYQPLPVCVQLVAADFCVKGKAAAPGQWLQCQMNLGVMSERLVVTGTFYRFLYGFSVCDSSLSELYIKSEAPEDNLMQNLQLHLSHELYLYFPVCLVPGQIQLRVLLLKLLQPVVCFMYVCPRWQNDSV